MWEITEVIFGAFVLMSVLSVLARGIDARQRLHAVIRAQEAERRRWARELHDETLQQLVVLRQQIAHARSALDLSAARRELTTVDATVARHTAALRHLITELRPAVLDDLGLEPALAALARRASHAETAEVAVAVTGRRALRPDTEAAVAVYRIAEESVTNALRHGHATAVRINLDVSAGGTTLTVTDNGTGFEPRQRRPTGHGITGMKERARLLGGRLSIASGTAGTRIAATFPGHGRGSTPRASAAPENRSADVPARVVTLDRAMWAARWSAAIYIGAVLAASAHGGDRSAVNLVGGAMLIVAMVSVNLLVAVLPPRASGVVQVVADAVITLMAVTVLRVDGSDAAWLGLPIVAAQAAIRFERKQATLTALLVVLAFTLHLVFGMAATAPRTPNVDLASAYALTAATVLIVFACRAGLHRSYQTRE